MTWTERAACAGHEGDWWTTAGPRQVQQRELNARAVSICRSCPVQQECLDDAIDRGDVGVIRGGVALLVKGPKALEMRSCNCGTEFVPVNTAHIHCGEACSARAKRERDRNRVTS